MEMKTGNVDERELTNVPYEIACMQDWDALFAAADAAAESDCSKMGAKLACAAQ